MGMTVTRLATAEDLPDIHAMICALSDFHGDTATITTDLLSDAFFGPCPSATALVATQGGEPVGYAGLTWNLVLHSSCVRIDIHHLFVHKDHRGKGIGTALIAQAKTIAIARKAVRLTIGTAPDNAISIAAYHAMPALTEITGKGPRFSVDLTPPDGP